MATEYVMGRLLEWMDKSTCNFTAVRNMREELDTAGFKRLDERDAWQLERGGRYYMTKNGSALFAFIVGEGNVAENGFRIISAHSDSPCFKIKPNAEMYGDGGIVKLNVEKYGGGIMYTWFDRPLSIAGRVAVRGNDWEHPLEYVVDLHEPVCTIPHLAIHFNRAVNEGNPLSVQKDMLPVLGYFSDEEIAEHKSRGGLVRIMVARELGIQPEDIVDYELCLYPVEKARIIGVNGQFFQSGRIDDLSMAYAGLQAMLDEHENKTAATRVLAVFDNEETGSGTKQGAASPVLRNILERICLQLCGNREDYYRAIASSFMISADDAHAWHPNYDGKYDPTNHAVMGGGPVIKINANCKYMSDSRGAAVFNELCREAGVKAQYFVNHSDSAGGSTLGNIATSQFDIEGVDVGNAIWAMHSAAETASVDDQLAMVKAMRLFFR
jgi:aspartyl aminopeptidase